MNTQSRRAAFSIVETLIVVAIIGILFSLVIPAMRDATLRQRGSAESVKLALIENAKRQFLIDHPNENLGESDAEAYELLKSYLLTENGQTIRDAITGAGGEDAPAAQRFQFSYSAASAPYPIRSMHPGETITGLYDTKHAVVSSANAKFKYEPWSATTMQSSNATYDVLHNGFNDIPLSPLELANPAGKAQAAQAIEAAQAAIQR